MILVQINNGQLQDNYFCENNEVGLNYINSAWSGIYMTRQKNFSIHNNVIKNSVGYHRNENNEWVTTTTIEGNGIHLNYAGDNLIYNCFGKIYNNTIYNNKNNGLVNNNMYGLEVKNNILYNNGLETDKYIYILRHHSSLYTYVFNNNLYKKYNYRWRINDNPETQVWWIQNYPLDENWIGIEPGIIDPINNNFHLSSTSLAVNQGESLNSNYYQYDYYNKRRSLHLPWDIGASEYTGGIKPPIEVELVEPSTENSLIITFNDDIMDEKKIDKNNFYINKLDIKNIKVLSSNKIELSTSKLEDNKDYLLVTNNIKDKDDQPISFHNKMKQFTTENNLSKNSAALTYLEFNLYQNYPNPFNPLTKIHYTIPKHGLVTIKVYDILGKEITQLVNEVKQPGKYEVEFDGSSLSSGIYFYQIQSENYLMTKKMILMK